MNKAEAVRDYVKSNPEAKPSEVVNALKKSSIDVTARYVSEVRRRAGERSKKSAKTRKSRSTAGRPASATDPFWGEKLLKKVAENIVSALKTPEEAIFRKVLEHS